MAEVHKLGRRGFLSAGLATAGAAVLAPSALGAPARAGYSQFVREANRAAMHVRVNGKWLQRFKRNADREAPAGGAHSNVLDLAKWMMLRLTDGEWRGRRLISPAALVEADTPHSVSSPPATSATRPGFYGLGVDTGADFSGRVRLS